MKGPVKVLKIKQNLVKPSILLLQTAFLWTYQMGCFSLKVREKKYEYSRITTRFISMKEINGQY